MEASIDKYIVKRYLGEKLVDVFFEIEVSYGHEKIFEEVFGLPVKNGIAILQTSPSTDIPIEEREEFLEKHYKEIEEYINNPIRMTLWAQNKKIEEILKEVNLIGRTQSEEISARIGYILTKPKKHWWRRKDVRRR